MNRFTTLTILTLPFFFLASCHDNGIQDEGELVIYGKLENAASISLLLEELTPTDLIPVDSITTDEYGNFKFSKDIDDAGFYRITLNSSNFITLAVEPHQKINITADVQDLPATYRVEGSHGSHILWKLNKERLSGVHKADSLRQLYRESRSEPDFPTRGEELRAHYRQLRNDQRDFVIEIIENNPEHLASILALYQYFENRLLLKESEHFDYFELLSKKLCNSYPTNKHVIDLKKRVNDYKREQEQKRLNEKNLAIGNPAPDIILPDTEGEQLSLSSFRGNVVLIDFWASWCTPCRAANKKLTGIYEKYNPKGFEIYGVSLDRNRDNWLEAIKQDNITWPQVSDLRFMNSPVVTLYNISDIPHTVLVGRDGSIIARGFSIDDLENLLAENL